MNVAKIHRKLIITESQLYFANISLTKARIFMKFESYDHKIVVDHQKDLCEVINTCVHISLQVRVFSTHVRASLHRSF